MRFPSIPSPMSLAVLTLATALAGCSSLNDFMAGDKVDYRSQAKRTSGLEVPPDLTQLAREGRYQPPAAVVSAAAAPASVPSTTVATAADAGPAAVAPNAIGDMHVVREGNTRWLSVPTTPEALWPQVRSFWLERGFTIASEDPKAGVMETDWAENRAKLPQDGIRALLGKVLDRVYDTGTRDRFRTHIERTLTGSDVYISHNGVREVYVTDQKEQTRWTTEPSDPQLEGEFLARLMVRLGSSEDVARTAIAAPDEAKPVRARLVDAPGAASLELDDPVDRAWRRVGLALDRTGFTVEDRNRAEGIYYVRYVDPNAKPEAKGFLGRIFSSDDGPAEARRYRVALKPEGDTRTTVTIQNGTGGAVQGGADRQIAGVLLAELR